MSHADFTKLIAEEGAKLGELYVQRRRTFLHRDRDSTSHSEWERACYAFRSYVSRLDPYIERACKKVRYADKDKNLLEFVVCFLEVDPWFDGSGYLKQIFLTRVKRSDLNEATKERLRRVLLDAVNRRGTREFKYYCRLAAVIGDEGLVAALEKASDNNDGAVARRAKLMLGTIRQRQREVSRAQESRGLCDCLDEKVSGNQHPTQAVERTDTALSRGPAAHRR